jgi:hypothetical protein
MAAILNHAIAHAIAVTNYNLEGSVCQDANDPDAWNVIFSMPSVCRVLHIEVLLGDGMASSCVLKQENMSDRSVERLMNLLMDAIDISDDDAIDISDDDEEPTTPNVNA